MVASNISVSWNPRDSNWNMAQIVRTTSEIVVKVATKWNSFRGFTMIALIVFILDTIYVSCDQEKCTKPNTNNHLDYRINGSIIERFHPAGFCECLSRCYHYGNCYSINYHKAQLSCTINARRVDTLNPLTYDPGWEYIEIPNSTIGSDLGTAGCKSCKDDHVCVVLKTKTAVCIGALSPIHSDVVLLLDDSNSINNSVMENQKTYAKQILPLLNLSRHRDHLAAYAVTNSTATITSFSWNEVTIRNAIDNLVHRSEPVSNYSRGVEVALNYLHDARRPNYRTFIVGCTDDPDSLAATEVMVSKANAAGITVITAGLQLSQPTKASSPEYFFSTDFVRLLDLSKVIADIITRKCTYLLISIHLVKHCHEFLNIY